MSDKENIKVNFFKPASPHAKANSILIFICVAIWAIAVFGFQFALIWTSKMTPEPTYESFEKVWKQINSGEDVPKEAYQEYARDLLMVLGKNIAVSDSHKSVLKNRLSLAILEMVNGEVRQSFHDLYKLEEEMLGIASRLYELKNPDAKVVVEMKKELEDKIKTVKEVRSRLAKVSADTIGLKKEGLDKIMRDMLLLSLVGIRKEKLTTEEKKNQPEAVKLYYATAENGKSVLLGLSSKKLCEDRVTIGGDFTMLYLMNIKEKHDLKISSKLELSEGSCQDSVPDIMNKYLHHLEGPLTKMRILGFPFHYWYSAQFLLILFVLLCVFYGIMIEKINRKHQFEEDGSQTC